MRAGLSVLLVLAGCAGARVAPDAAPDLDDDRGLAVVVVDTDVPLEDVRFRGVDADAEITIEAAAPGRTAHLFRVPAGRYVLVDFATPRARFDPRATDRRLCFAVAPQRTAYPGHLVFRGPRGDDPRAGWGWQAFRPDLEARLDASWPGLRARYPVVGGGCDQST